MPRSLKVTDALVMLFCAYVCKIKKFGLSAWFLGVLIVAACFVCFSEQNRKNVAFLAKRNSNYQLHITSIPLV